MRAIKIFAVLWLALVSIAAILSVPGARAGNNEPAALTAGVSECYLLDSTKVGFRLALNAADTFTTAAILATPDFALTGQDKSGVSQNGACRQNIRVAARSTNASQSVTCQIAYVFRDSTGSKIKGWSNTFVLTTSSVQKEGAYYESPDAVFDSAGASDFRVIVTSWAGAGTFDLWVGSY